jgi:hypothetical protein
MNTYDIAAILLPVLGAPVTSGMRRAVGIWMRFETGRNIIGNNPWNLHSGPACPEDIGYCEGYGDLPGQIGNRYAGDRDKNVAVFGTIEAGVEACARNLLRDGYGYPAVVKAARANKPRAFLRALQESQWSAGNYANDGQGKLVDAWDGSGDYNDSLTFTMPVAKGDLTVLKITSETLYEITIPAGAKIYDLDGRYRKDNPSARKRRSLYTTAIDGTLYYAARLLADDELLLVKTADVTARGLDLVAADVLAKAKATVEAAKGL